MKINSNLIELTKKEKQAKPATRDPKIMDTLTGVWTRQLVSKPTKDKANGGIERRDKTQDGLDARLRKRSVHVGGRVIGRDRNQHSLVGTGLRFAVAQFFFALEIQSTQRQ